MVAHPLGLFDDRLLRLRLLSWRGELPAEELRGLAERALPFGEGSEGRSFFIWLVSTASLFTGALPAAVSSLDAFSGGFERRFTRCGLGDAQEGHFSRTEALGTSKGAPTFALNGGMGICCTGCDHVEVSDD